MLLANLDLQNSRVKEQSEKKPAPKAQIRKAVSSTALKMEGVNNNGVNNGTTKQPSSRKNNDPFLNALAASNKAIVSFMNNIENSFDDLKKKNKRSSQLVRITSQMRLY